MERHAPLNAIWEGSGNVIALDILKGFKALPHLWADITSCRGADVAFDNYCDELSKILQLVSADPLSLSNQRAARNIVDKLACAMQASILIRHGDSVVARCFIASRIAPDSGRPIAGASQGALCVFSEKDCDYIINRNMPRSI